MTAIKTVDLTKVYRGVAVVDHLNLEVKRGEVLALLGVNGAGKTTTIRMLSTLICPSEGDAFLEGFSIREQPAEVKRIIGISPQESALAPNLTVRENLEFLCGVYRLNKEQTKQKTEELIERFSLGEVTHKRASKLSGGFARRLSIAMALVSEPKILFLDEPTLGLDVFLRSDLWELIRCLKGHTTIVLTTHYMEEAKALSDRVAVLKDGKLLALTEAEKLIEDTGAQTFEDAFVRLVQQGGKTQC